MPAVPAYPGVFVEDLPFAAHTIEGLATAITAFVGRAPRGPLDQDPQSPVRVRSEIEYEPQFGGLDNDCPMSFAVHHYFANGGSEALIVRVARGAATAQTPAAPEAALFSAANPGAWGNQLRLRIDHDLDAATLALHAPGTVFNLAVKDLATGVTEFFRGLSIVADHPRFVSTVLAAQSRLLRGAPSYAERPASNAPAPAATPDAFSHISSTVLSGGSDGQAPGEAELTGASGLRAQQRGLYALEKADLFNLLVVPPLAPTADVTPGIWSAAALYCSERRAALLVDPPSNAGGWAAASAITDHAITNVLPRSANAAMYFPRLLAANPLRAGRTEAYAPSGAVAGVIARVDAQRGVWKAPAGLEAQLRGVLAPALSLTDEDQRTLNPLAVNAIRAMPNAGVVVWGARTMAGVDAVGSEWKYLPVRRLALHLEESLLRGLAWVVLEPNGERLWQQIRLSVGNFLNSLFRQGAFQGASATDAYFVRCDATTTSPADIAQGVAHCLVGFAPLKPAEFVVLRLQLRAADET